MDNPQANKEKAVVSSGKDWEVSRQQSMDRIIHDAETNNWLSNTSKTSKDKKEEPPSLRGAADRDDGKNIDSASSPVGSAPIPPAIKKVSRGLRRNQIEWEAKAAARRERDAAEQKQVLTTDRRNHRKEVVAEISTKKLLPEKDPQKVPESGEFNVMDVVNELAAVANNEDPGGLATELHHFASRQHLQPGDNDSTIQRQESTSHSHSMNEDYDDDTSEADMNEDYDDDLSEADAAVMTMPHDTPIVAELVDECAATRAFDEIVQAKDEEIERLKRDLEQLHQQLQVHAAAPVVEVLGSTDPDGESNAWVSSDARDITTEIDELVVDPLAAQDTFPEADGESNNKDQLRFSSLGLVGRDEEQQILVSCLERAAAKGTREMILLSGYSGTGKSALASTLQDKVLHKKGLYISGKFDLYLRDEPYEGVASACQELCTDLLGMPGIREDIVSELGEDMEVLVKILPGLQGIIVGEGPECPLGPQVLDEAKNRIAHAFRRFFRIICSYHPCFVLSLDDLQWADVASMELLESLIADDCLSNFVVVGCYRSNEVDETHLVSKMIREVEVNTGVVEGRVHMTQVAIGNLESGSVHSMLQKLLFMNKSETFGLSKICHKKTHGNAFFLIQFIGHLHDQGLLKYSSSLKKWTWDINDISSKTSSTMNVVDLVQGKMQNLPDDVIQLLPILACLGSSVEESILSVVWHAYCRQNGNDIPIEPLLETLVEDGFLEHRSSTYRFVHDKIQEAAMAIPDPDELESLKATVGKFLVEELNESSLEDSLFVAANLLNEGLSRTSLDSQLELARLNLRAAEKSVLVSAFLSASKYALKGIDLLPSNKWLDHYKLTLDLHSLAAEVLGFLGKYDTMKMHCNEVLQNATALLDTFRVHNCILDSYYSQRQYEKGLNHGLDLLKQLGHKIPRRPFSIMISTLAGVARTSLAINSKLKEIVNALPSMTDPCLLQAMVTLDKCCTAAYLLSHDILPLLVFKNVELTLKFGISVHSPPAFGLLAIILLGVFDDFRRGSIASKIATKLMAKSRVTAPRTAFCFGAAILPWFEPLQQVLPKTVKAYHDGLCIGDTESAMWNIVIYAQYGVFTGRKLSLLEADCEVYRKQMLELGRPEQAIHVEMEANHIANLTGNFRLGSSIEQFGLVVGLEPSVYNNDTMTMGQEDLRMKKNCLYSIFGHHTEGAELSIARGDGFRKETPGLYQHMVDAFHRSVSLFAVARESKKAKYRQHAQKHRKLVKMWTKKGCPNATHYKLILDAENAALKNHSSKAKDLYEKAIEASIASGYANDAALACERFGLFFAVRNE